MHFYVASIKPRECRGQQTCRLRVEQSQVSLPGHNKLRLLVRVLDLESQSVCITEAVELGIQWDTHYQAGCELERRIRTR